MLDFAGIGTGGQINVPGTGGVPAETALNACADYRTPPTTVVSYATATAPTWTLTGSVNAFAWRINNTSGAQRRGQYDRPGRQQRGPGRRRPDLHVRRPRHDDHRHRQRISGANANANLFVAVDQNSRLTVGAPLIGAGGTGTLVKSGLGELVVTSSAGYSGGTVINFGTRPRRRLGPLQRPAGAELRRRLRHQRQLHACR